MKRIFRSVCALLLGALCYSCNDKAEFRSVDVTEFTQVIAEKDVVLLDVRTADEHAAGHIDGTSLHIDVLKEDFEEQALAQIKKGSTVALYCRSGNRSKRAASILAANGYKVIELATGYNGWVETTKQ